METVRRLFLCVCLGDQPPCTSFPVLGHCCLDETSELLARARTSSTAEGSLEELPSGTIHGITGWAVNCAGDVGDRSHGMACRAALCIVFPVFCWGVVLCLRTEQFTGRRHPQAVGHFLGAWFCVYVSDWSRALIDLMRIHECHGMDACVSVHVARDPK